MAKRADEIIAFHLGWDVADMRECRYQPSKYKVAVYACGDSYYCAPSNETPPKGFRWMLDGVHYGRKVFTATTEVA